jgi:RNA polymerase sigma-70 factor (ECF subfamily)
MNNTPESQLIELAAAGDLDAFGEIARRYEGMMSAHVARSVPNWADVCEIVQDALMDAFRNMGRFDTKRRLTPWLRAICRNRVRKFYRDVMPKRESCVSLVDGRMAEKLESSIVGKDGGRTESVVVDALFECMGRMNTGHRKLLDLRYFDNLPVKDVAALSGRSCGCVLQTLLRARRNLRSCVLRQLAAG